MHRSLSIVVCLVALAAAGVCPAANPAFRISIDTETWRKFGWQYPASYVFQVSAGVHGRKVSRRDAPGDTWAPLAANPRGAPFNGVECVRYDPEANRVYVSVGFKSRPVIIDSLRTR